MWYYGPPSTNLLKSKTLAMPHDVTVHELDPKVFCNGSGDQPTFGGGHRDVAGAGAEDVKVLVIAGRWHAQVGVGNHSVSS